jgi:hypothetical protein
MLFWSRIPLGAMGAAVTRATVIVVACWFLGTLDEACFAVVTRDGRDHNWRRSDEQVGDVRSPPCGPGITAVQAARPASSRVPMTRLLALFCARSVAL